jgi:hypothetical protein
MADTINLNIIIWLLQYFNAVCAILICVEYTQYKWKLYKDNIYVYKRGVVL